MTDKRDYYEVLGIGRTASNDEIRSAYRRLAKQFHPDVNREDGAEERFKEINEAYAVLSDTERRASYDRFGHAGLKGMNFDFDFGFGDIFEEFFGFGMGGRRARNAPRRGADLRYDITLEFEEAAFGVEREIQFTRQEVCSTCNGSGAEPGTTPVRCSTCNGSGEVRQVRQTFLGSMVNVNTCPTCGGRGETISTPCRNCSGRGLERVQVSKTIPIPAGVDNGTQIRLAGEGEPGVNGGPKGNMYVIVRVKPHRFFRRKNDDVLLDLAVNIAQASLGAEIEVPTLDGEETLSIPAGTQTGKVIKMRGRGIPHLNRSGRGDQLVIVSVDIPRNLDARQSELLEELAETLGTEVKVQERSFLDSLKDLLGGLAD
ncbi:MAG: molecular chaperone DnaJ [Anaerolineales bacterium]|nr:molecular chaperone DnaJ [Anaerolineales bacterium]